jgi:hypothetical protein
MIETTVAFSVIERPNTFKKAGKEWALNVKIGDHNHWTLKTWDTNPRESAVEDTKEVILRAFEFYHRHLSIPRFKITVVDE